MRSKIYPGNYLAFLASKYDVDVEKLFNALAKAWKNQKAECGNLAITLRHKDKGNLTMLITQESRFIAQFHITEEFLSQKSNIIRTTARNAQSFDSRSWANSSGQALQIKDLRIGMKKVNLKAKIIEVSPSTFVVTRFGNCASVANAIVSDETGKIKLCLWNDQISSVRPGDTVQIENATVSEFRHERQMRIGKKGTLRIEVTN